jgi:hypothetical protein
MSSRLALALSVILSLTACHRKKSHSEPASLPAGSSPALSLQITDLPFSDAVKAKQMTLEGRGCASIDAKLLLLTAEGQEDLATRSLTSLPDSFKGDLWFMVQDGEPFGKKGQLRYTLADALPAKSKTSMAKPRLFDNAARSMFEITTGSTELDPNKDEVVYTRCLMKGDQQFITGNLDLLRKQAADLHEDILVVTLRWAPRKDPSGR